MENIKYFAIMVLIALIAIGCSKELAVGNATEPIEEKIEPIKNDGLNDNFVTEEQAIEVANAFWGIKGGMTGLRSSGATRSNASVETIKNQSNAPLMYILNYPEGGWAIVSATKNFYPILAYSDENSFKMESSAMDPVEGWLTVTKNAINASETIDDSTKVKIRSMWNNYTTKLESSPTTNLRSSDPLSDALNMRMSQLGSMYGYGSSYKITTLMGAQSLLSSNSEWQSLCNYANSLGSPPAYTIFVGRDDYPTQTVGPLLATHWDQKTPFNDLAPNKNPAGCGAIAVAQVLKYYQYPQSLSWNGYTFDWSSIPIPPTSSSNQAKLVQKVGDAVKMHYFSFGSWATPGDMESGIRSFGYNVTRASHNYNLVRTQLLTYQRPVIMGGNADNVPLPSPLNYVGSSHYWVCDGAKDLVHNIIYFIEFINTYNYTYYTTSIYNPTNPFNSEQYRYLYFNMNWGWGGAFDGWFLYYDVNSGNGNFQYAREDFYITKP